MRRSGKDCLPENLGKIPLALQRFHIPCHYLSTNLTGAAFSPPNNYAESKLLGRLK